MIEVIFRDPLVSWNPLKDWTQNRFLMSQKVRINEGVWIAKGGMLLVWEQTAVMSRWSLRKFLWQCGATSISLIPIVTSCNVWTETASDVRLAKLPNDARYCFVLVGLFHNFCQWKCFAVSVQHDADEVFLSILNFMQQQMDNRALVCL